MVYVHEDWPTITWGNKKADLWEAPWVILGLQGRGREGGVTEQWHGAWGSRDLRDEVLGFTLGSRPLDQELGQAVLDCVVEKWQLRGSQGDGWRSEPGEVFGEDLYFGN